MTAPAKPTIDEQPDTDCEHVRLLFKKITGVDVTVRIVDGYFFVTDPAGEEYSTGLVRKQ